MTRPEAARHKGGDNQGQSGSGRKPAALPQPARPRKRHPAASGVDRLVEQPRLELPPYLRAVVFGTLRNRGYIHSAEQGGERIAFRPALLASGKVPADLLAAFRFTVSVQDQL